jgi:hypothetical protein
VANNTNKSEDIIYHEVVAPTTAIVVRVITDSRDRHFVDVRQFFKQDPEDEGWSPTRMGVRLRHEALAAIAKVKLEKDPVDTKKVTTRIDTSIILPSKDGAKTTKAAAK